MAVGSQRPRKTSRPEVDDLVVHLADPKLGGEQVVGTMRHQRARGISVISFAYDEPWVRGPNVFQLDKQVPLGLGDQYPPTLPGVIADTSPDRWGTILMERREAQLAAEEGRKPRTLEAWDLLIRVNDETRMGALRFATMDAVFLASDPRPVPPMARLRELEQIAAEVEAGGPLRASTEELLDLVAPGSSLGGNRPKANFRDDDGILWIAKFPSNNDRWDVGAWEYLLNQLAPAAGITVAPTKLLGPYTSGYHTFASQRFDRRGAERRLFASAMTVAGKQDHTDASYLDIASAIIDNGDPGAIDADLEQLFRRLVFNILVGHRDDHLRNHGFLREPKGWRLAPVYDLNPRPDMKSHVLAIDGGRLHEPDLKAVIETAALYRLNPQRAGAIVDEVRGAIAPWRKEAARQSIRSSEIEVIAAAFPA